MRPARAAGEKTLLLRPEPAEEFALRAIGAGDLELMRTWKNLHRRAFFHQDIITPQAQEAWFAGYLTRPQDWMFLVVVADQPAGVLGWRDWQGRADIYNVMRGQARLGGPGLMSRAMALMLSHILAAGREDIVARVVKGNPALAWYERNLFVLERDHGDHLLVRLDLARFGPRDFTLGKGD